MVRPNARWLLVPILTLMTSSASWGQQKSAETLPVREIRAPKGMLSNLEFSPDGKLLAGVTESVIRVWNADDGKEVVRMQLPHLNPYRYLQFTFAHDGKTLIWHSWDEKIRIFDVKTGKQIDEIRQPYSDLNGDKSIYHFLAFSPDRKRIAYRGALSQGVDLFDLTTRRIVLQFDKTHYCENCVFSGDGKMIAMNASNRVVRGAGDEGGAPFPSPPPNIVDDVVGVSQWDAVTGKLLKVLPTGPGATVESFSPDGKFLATKVERGGLSVRDNSFSVWSVKTGKSVYTFAHKSSSTPIFSPDGLSLLYMPQIWETNPYANPVLHNLVAEKDVLTFKLPNGRNSFVGFSPDFKRLAVVGSSSIRDENGNESIYLFDVPARAFDPAEAHFEDAPFEKLWKDLSSDNELRLQIVLKSMRAAPKQAVAMVAKMAPPVTKECQQDVEKLIADLDDDSFVRRDEVMKKVQDLAHQFAPLLKKKLSQAPAGEVRNRLSFVLEKMGPEPLPAAMVAELRALALLEELATREARELLEQLAQGADGARLTCDARAALERLKTKAK